MSLVGFNKQLVEEIEETAVSRMTFGVMTRHTTRLVIVIVIKMFIVQ